MKKFLKKIKIKLFLLESIALFLFINGIKKLYVAFHSNDFEVLLVSDWRKFSQQEYSSALNIMNGRIYWSIYGFIFFIIILYMVNKYLNESVVNIGLIIFIFIILFLNGVFGDNNLNDKINQLCISIGGEIKTGFFIVGSLFVLISFLFLLFLIRKKPLV